MKKVAEPGKLIHSQLTIFFDGYLIINDAHA